MEKTGHEGRTTERESEELVQSPEYKRKTPVTEERYHLVTDENSIYEYDLKCINEKRWRNVTDE